MKRFWKNLLFFRFFSDEQGVPDQAKFFEKKNFPKKCRKLFEIVENDCSLLETEFEHRLPCLYRDFPQKLYWKTRKMKIYPNFRDLWNFSLWFSASGGQNVPACKFSENSQRFSKVTSIVRTGNFRPWIFDFQNVWTIQFRVSFWIVVAKAKTSFTYY